MGSCYSSEDTTVVQVVVANDVYGEIEKWNKRREDVLKNIDSLTKFYMSMDTRNERLRLIEENLEVFQEFFNLPPVSSNILEQIEHMFQSGLRRYVKSSK
jgi:hypothetical protein